jgi:predicted dehydrogenase
LLSQLSKNIAMKSTTNRRSFLKITGAASAVGTFGFPNILHAQNKGDKLRVALIATAGKGGAHIDMVKQAGDIVVAHCDVDKNRQGSVLQHWPQSRFYQDYRILLEKEMKNIDAIMVSTPDHHHYLPTALAMEAGKHCYTQKPLVHTVWEARQLLNGVNKFKVATQMGNQGHSNDGNRQIYEYVNSGMLGDVTEIHCVTNRPIWPQGMESPAGEDPVPANLDWDLWLGPAPMRPFKGGRTYHDFNWRGWCDFGGGALADMACHTMDSIFWSLNPGLPSSVEVLEIYGHTKEAFPKGAIFRWTYAAGILPNGKPRPELVIYWYEGKLLKDGKEVLAAERVRRPEKLPADHKMSRSGNVYFGTKNDLLIEGDYGNNARIVQTADEMKSNPIGKPPQLLARNPDGENDYGQYMDWQRACKGEKAWNTPGSNFTYAAPFTESILLGNIALRVGKMNEKLIYDGKNMRFTNSEEANKFLTKEYRKGWEHKLV